MIKERNQIAQAFRAYGEGKKADGFKTGKMRSASILSSAYAKGESIKGKADAEASKIYADSFGEILHSSNSESNRVISKDNACIQ